MTAIVLRESLDCPLAMDENTAHFKMSNTVYPEMMMAPAIQNKSVPKRNAITANPAIIASKPTRYKTLDRAGIAERNANDPTATTPRIAWIITPPLISAREKDTRCWRYPNPAMMRQRAARIDADTPR